MASRTKISREKNHIEHHEMEKFFFSSSQSENNEESIRRSKDQEKLNEFRLNQIRSFEE